MSAEIPDPVEEWLAECSHTPVCWSERDCIALDREDYPKWADQ